MAAQKPLLRLGISACLLGDPVRWNGGHKRDRNLEVLSPWVEWVPVCPEVAVGLGVPREPVRLMGRPGDVRLKGDKAGDITDDMVAFGKEWLGNAGVLHGFVLKRGSPSCGPSTNVWAEPGKQSGQSPGVFAAQLTHLPIQDEGRLHDSRLREAFLDHCLARRRWFDLVESEPQAADLIAFHARNKCSIMAHSPAALNDLGHLVADAGVRDVLDEYGGKFLAAFAEPTTPGRHVNVMEHLLGFLKELPSELRQDMAAQIHAYQHELVPLIVPIALLRHHAAVGPPWMREQTYLDPFPAEWLLRTRI